MPENGHGDCGGIWIVKKKKKKILKKSCLQNSYSHELMVAQPALLHMVLGVFSCFAQPQLHETKVTYLKLTALILNKMYLIPAEFSETSVKLLPCCCRCRLHLKRVLAKCTDGVGVDFVSYQATSVFTEPTITIFGICDKLNMTESQYPKRDLQCYRWQTVV